jgi:signal transduction histidine kinase
MMEMTCLGGPAGSRAARAARVAAARLRHAGVVRAARQVPGWAADGALGAGFLAAMLIALAGQGTLSGARLLSAVVLSAVIAGGLALRRRAPLTAYLAGSSALVAQALWVSTSPVAPYANLIGLYSLGLYATRGRAWCGLLIVPAAVFGYFSEAGSPAPDGPAGVLLVWLLALAVGYGAARRREAHQAARQATQRQAAAEERTRLARELHDIVGHTVNVMVVQAGAARLVLDRDPAKTREILSGLEQTGRQALAELDRMLGLLRRDGPPAARPAGQPGPGIPADEAGLTVPSIAELPRLARRMAEAGIRVTVRLGPPVPQVTRSADLSAYRIVQEALTNTLKHGHARSASVTVRLNERAALDIEVSDDGRGPTAGYLPGRGLLGIAERVAAFGGTLEHGGGEQGGFRLRAVLPAS